MICPKRAGEILRKHFQELSQEDFEKTLIVIMERLDKAREDEENEENKQDKEDKYRDSLREESY